MKTAVFYAIGAFLVLFAAIYAGSKFIGTDGGGGANTAAAVPGETSGVWLKIISSNPANKGADGSFIMKTGPATANPYLKVGVESSADCLKCHGDKALIFSHSDHMAGSVSKAAILSAGDETCAECHSIKTVNGKDPDMDAAVSAIFPEGKSGENARFVEGITCIGCHGSGEGNHYSKLNFIPDDCGTCHERPATCYASSKNPLAGKSVKNFKLSTHATGVTGDKFKEKTGEIGLLQNYERTEYFAETGGEKCLMCHQNASFQKYYAQKTRYIDGNGKKYYANYTDNNTASFSRNGIGPFGFGITLLNDNESDPGLLCSTCHDVHSGSFTRKAVYVSKDSSGDSLTRENGEPIIEPLKVFSAEFRLCTICHAVDLNYAWDAENNRFDYYLNPAAHDNATGVEDAEDLTLKTAKIINGKVDVSNANPFYYDYTQGQHLKYDGGKERPLFTENPDVMALAADLTIIDTHFKGTIVTQVAESDGIPYILKRENVSGYNINAAAERPCSGCHDPHMNSKFGSLPGDDSKMYSIDAKGFKGGLLKTAQADADVISVTETWAFSPHADYKSTAFNKDDFEAECMKCHSGYESAKYIAGVKNPSTLDNVSSALYGTGGEIVTCVTCHELDITDKEKNMPAKLGAVRTWKSDNFSFSWIDQPYAAAEKDIISAENMIKIGTSALCFNCHDGVRSARLVSRFADDAPELNKPFDHKKLSVHYSPAASVFWGNAAYEFPDKTYDQGAFPQHKTSLMKKGGAFKTPEEAAVEEKAYVYACADCHDFDGMDHSSEAMIEEISESGERTVKGIRMTEKRIKTGCAEKGCHGEDGTDHAGKMQSNRDAYLTAVSEAAKALEKAYDLKLDTKNKTFVYASAPDEKFISWGKGEDGRNLYGAAENLYILAKLDSGAYSHNPIYVKQILWDIMEMTGETFSDKAKRFVNPTRP